MGRFRRRACALAAIAAVVAPTTAGAAPRPAPAPGALDASFGAGGTVVAELQASGSDANAVAVQPDGRIVVAGSSGPEFMRSALVARFLPDGGLDPTFGDGGSVRLDVSDDDYEGDVATGVALEPDGDIVVAGAAYVDGAVGATLYRLLPDGTPDPAFGQDGLALLPLGAGRVGRADAVALQRDGRIVVAGSTRGPDRPDADLLVARYRADGTPDPRFGTGGVVVTDASGDDDASGDVEVLRDGRVLVAGSTDVRPSTDPDGDIALVRYRRDGSLDAGFGVGGVATTDFAGADDRGHALAVQPDGRVVVAGSTEPAWDRMDVAVVRYRRDGSLDRSFGTGGRVTTGFADVPGRENDEAADVALLPNGTIVTAGIADHDDSRLCGCGGLVGTFGLVRYLPDGTLDARFGTGGRVTTDVGPGVDRAAALARAPGDRLVAAGVAWPEGQGTGGYDVAVARYHAGGR